jgi:Spy/CpxP family protein refolding chaperone
VKALLQVIMWIALGFSSGWLASVLRYDLEPFPRPFSPRGGSPLDPIELSSEQKVAVQGIRERFAEEHQRLRSELEAARARFDQALGTSQDRKILEEAWSELEAKDGQLRQHRFRQMVAIHEVLTPEQIQELRVERKRQLQHIGRQHVPGGHPAEQPDRPPPPVY